MDTVSYAFCDSVAAILQSPSSLRQFSSKIWQEAAEHNAKSRLNADLYIAYTDDGWSYQIVRKYNVHSSMYSSDTTLQELQKWNKRHLRIDLVFVTNFIDLNRIQSSFEEIKTVATYSLLCINMAKLEVRHTKSFPQDNLSELLSIYENTAFSEIVTIGNNERTLDFLLPHLGPRSLTLYANEQACSARLKNAIRDFALRHNCGYRSNDKLSFLVQNAEFDMDFFKEFFAAKTITRSQIFNCYFSFNYDDLKQFEKDFQIASSAHNIEWRRANGTKVIACYYGYDNQITFEFVNL